MIGGNGFPYANSGGSPCGEFWQCLSLALLPPRGEVFFQALRDDLSADLEDLACRLDLDLASAIDGLRAALVQTDVETLLPAYSSLFLTPPIPARLNICFYLDGTLLGANTKMLSNLYLRHGVAQSPDMHDTPDHLATTLEFLALLLQQADAESDDEFLKDANEVRLMLLRALPELQRRVVETEQERALPDVYSALLQIVLTALRDEREVFFFRIEEQKKAPARRYFAKRESATDMVGCKQCGKPVATARELKVIIDRLRLSGLPTDHLELCPDCRDGTRGWKPGKTDFNLPGFR